LWKIKTNNDLKINDFLAMDVHGQFTGPDQAPQTPQTAAKVAGSLLSFVMPKASGVLFMPDGA